MTMQMIAPDQMESATAQPMGRVAFDIVRAMVQARQAATPTVVALIGALHPPADHAQAKGAAKGAFAPGRLLLDIVHGAAGADAQVVEGEGFARDDVVGKGGEQHA